MKTDIERYAKSRVSCAQAKASYSKYGGLLHPLPTPDFPWEVRKVDLVMGLPKGDHDFDAIATCVCQLTKTAHFAPVYHTVTAGEMGHTCEGGCTIAWSSICHHQ